MTIQVEFYGIPRQRAGMSATTASGASLREVLADLAARLPEWAAACLEQGKLRPGYLANINAERFVSDLDTPLAAGDALLIMSADAGG